MKLAFAHEANTPLGIGHEIASPDSSYHEFVNDRFQSLRQMHKSALHHMHLRFHRNKRNYDKRYDFIVFQPSDLVRLLDESIGGAGHAKLKRPYGATPFIVEQCVDASKGIYRVIPQAGGSSKTVNLTALTLYDTRDHAPRRQPKPNLNPDFNYSSLAEETVSVSSHPDDQATSAHLSLSASGDADYRPPSAYAFSDCDISTPVTNALSDQDAHSWGNITTPVYSDLPVNTSEQERLAANQLPPPSDNPFVNQGLEDWQSSYEPDHQFQAHPAINIHDDNPYLGSDESGPPILPFGT